MTGAKPFATIHSPRSSLATEHLATIRCMRTRDRMACRFWRFFCGSVCYIVDSTIPDGSSEVSNSRKQFDQRAVVLAGLAASEGATFRPIHVQKLFFLIDQKIPDLIGGPYFTFRPFSYGPFDHAVYRVLERLEGEGAVEIIGDRWSPYRSYRLTEMGQVEGQDILSAIDWYNDQEPHLGNEFESERLELSANLKRFPQMAPVIAPGIRRAIFPLFPFSLFYKIQGETIVVVAVIHTSRHPDTWRSR